MENQIKTTIRLPKSLSERVRIVAKKNQTSIQKTMIRLLNLALSQGLQGPAQSTTQLPDSENADF